MLLIRITNISTINIMKNFLDFLTTENDCNIQNIEYLVKCFHEISDERQEIFSIVEFLLLKQLLLIASDNKSKDNFNAIKLLLAHIDKHRIDTTEKNEFIINVLNSDLEPINDE